MRASEVHGRDVYDAAGRRLGRVVDLVTGEAGPHGRLRLTHVVVAPHRYLRLIGFRRRDSAATLFDHVTGPLRREIREVACQDVRLDPPVDGFPGLGSGGA